MNLKITVLGCGGSMGVPAPGFGWSDCDPNEPKNQRTRVSILIQQDDYTLLVDSGPDVRQQLIVNNVKRVDAVICTHAHADHINGLDDIRPLMMVQNMNMPYYAAADTLAEVTSRFNYLFLPDTGVPAQNMRRQDLVPELIDKMGEINIGPMKLNVFAQEHGKDKSLGIRIGNFAYSTDTNALNDTALNTLAGIDTWVVDCNNRQPEDSFKHSDLAQVIDWNKRVKARQVYLTHLPGWHDYQTLKQQCPNSIEPAYDGLIIDL